MERIYLEHKDVLASSEPLGVPLAGHLYLVKKDGAERNDAVDRVIRGGPESGDLHVIANDLLNATNDAYGSDQSPATRGSYDITDLIPGGPRLGMPWWPLPAASKPATALMSTGCRSMSKGATTRQTRTP